MKKRIGYAVLLAILIVTCGSGFSPAQAARLNPAARAGGDSHYADGQLIVGFAPGVSQGTAGYQAAVLAQAVGAKVVKTDSQGITLLDIGAGKNIRALAALIKRMKGVRYVEPNYIYQDIQLAGGPGPAAATPPLAQAFAASAATGNPVYPNDPGLWANVGWAMIDAEIVWKNTTASKTVCELGSGVDYTHKDLAAHILKGYNFVSDNTDPMDDNGRGTHVAGIITAISNNNEGIAGVSTGKVVAVKVLDANGFGMLFDIAQGIRYCAEHADIVYVGWAGPWSQTLQDAVLYAITTKGKLVVAEAGDADDSGPDLFYPAAFTQSAYPFAGGVISVAATGQSTLDGLNYSCRAPFSNYGSWITMAAPGVNILSTTPWNNPFYLQKNGTNPHYDSMSSTAEAAAFVAGETARTWGYLPTDTNLDIKKRLQATGNGSTFDGKCWPDTTPSMASMTLPNLARAMDRGAIRLSVRNAITTMPVPGAAVTVYTASTSSQVGSGSVPAVPIFDPLNYTAVANPDYVDVLNVFCPVSPCRYYAKVSASNFTASAQAAFVGDYGYTYADGSFLLSPGLFVQRIVAYLPPKSANFTVVGEALNHAPYLAVWLPEASPSAQYLVSPYFHKTPPDYPDTAPDGSMVTFPYARFMSQDMFSQTIAIHNRLSDSAAPMYPGTYQVGISDDIASGLENQLDNNNVSAMVWKDGVIKARVDKDNSPPCGPDKHWWFPMTINSPASGATTYTWTPDRCGTIDDAPYK